MNIITFTVSLMFFVTSLSTFWLSRIFLNEDAFRKLTYAQDTVSNTNTKITPDIMKKVAIAGKFLRVLSPILLIVAVGIWFI